MLDDPDAAGRDVSPAPPEDSDPAVARFRACRWHSALTDGTEYCGHRDVKPYAGQHGFSPAAWCPECDFYKTRRRPRKDGDFDFNDNYDDFDD